MKVTAETITDEQIRTLRAQTGWKGSAAQLDQQTIALALSKPSWHLYDANKRDEARKLCAEWWNKRYG